MKQVRQVYPTTVIDEEFGGIRKFEAPPPIPKTIISLAGLNIVLDP